MATIIQVIPSLNPPFFTPFLDLEVGYTKEVELKRIWLKYSSAVALDHFTYWFSILIIPTKVGLGSSLLNIQTPVCNLLDII